MIANYASLLAMELKVNEEFTCDWQKHSLVISKYTPPNHYIEATNNRGAFLPFISLQEHNYTVEYIVFDLAYTTKFGCCVDWGLTEGLSLFSFAAPE